jgi:hypothetical protein
MSRRVLVGFVVPTVAMILVPVQANAQFAPSQDLAVSPVAEDAGVPVLEEEREAAMLRMQTLEVAPLVDADVQVLFVGEEIWTRLRCETRFLPAPRMDAGGSVQQFRERAHQAKERCVELFPEIRKEEVLSWLMKEHAKETMSVPDDQVIYHFPFEDGTHYPDWEVEDIDAAYGDDHWEVEACNPHFGNFSAWCSGYGDMGPCEHYDHGMNSQMGMASLIDLQDFTDVRMSYWAWHEGLDPHFYPLFPAELTMGLSNGGVYVLVYDHGVREENQWYEVDISLLDYPDQVRMKFFFEGVLNIYNNEGAYIDDVLIYGCPRLGQTTLVSPDDGAYICQDQGTWWCWDEDPLASSYDVQWDISPTFPTPLQASAIGPCYHRDLPTAGLWWWRAAAASSCSLGAWSPTRAVFVVANPAEPVPTEPADGADVCRGVEQTYSWLEGANSISSTVQWDDDIGFGSPIATQTLSGTSTSQALNGSADHYWRVRGNNAGCSGPWSEVRTINLIDCLDVIFTDGFESGGLGAWSVVAP